MRRLYGYVDTESNSVSFSDDELKHIRVIRPELGEMIEVISSLKAYCCRVVSLNPFIVSLGKEISQEESRDLFFSSVLCCPLLKGDHLALALQKATELGVSDIYPYVSSRTIVRLTAEEFEKKRERMEKIIAEAVEQSNRTSAPVLHALSSLEELSRLEGDYKLIAYEDEALKGQMIPELKLDANSKVISLIGPEGGFSPSEAQLFVNNGFVLISLGKRILRAETAIIYMLAVVSFQGEKNHG